MHLVLNKVVDQGNQCSEKETGENLAVFDSAAVCGAKSETAQCPWKSSNQIRNHEDIMPVMVIRRCHISPSTTGQCSEQTSESDNLGQRRTGPCGHQIPEKNESETGSGGDGNENLEN